MRHKSLILTLLAAFSAVGAVRGASSERILVTSDEQGQKAYAKAYPAKTMGGQLGVAVHFEVTDDLHFYADPETAPAPDLILKATAIGNGVKFGEAVFPGTMLYNDPSLNKQVRVFTGDFEVFIPATGWVKMPGPKDAEVTITGIACTSKRCLFPFEHTLSVTLDFDKSDTWPLVNLQSLAGPDKAQGPADSSPAQGQASYSWPAAFALALLAGLIINIMPCVWPVIPIIVTRIWQQAGESRGRSFTIGLFFSAGILLFFAAVAVVNIILQVGFGTVFQLGDLMRYPAFVSFLVLLLVALALFMFGVFSIGIPSSVTAKAGSGGSGLVGNIGMGFLAGLLGTPCSFGILVAAVAWAQTQPLAISTLTLLIIGVGMALPYLVLTSIPGLLSKMPKPGGWMETVKVGIGFLLIGIAVKFAGALDGSLLKATLYYAVVLGVCFWMWGQWVSFNTPARRKWGVRGAAVVIALLSGLYLFWPTPKYIDWQEYDAEAIDTALEQDRPVLIKFTADWCANCTVVKKRVFEQPDVAKLIRDKGILAIEADTTTKDMPATHALFEQYKEPGIPVTVLHLPDGREIHLRGIFAKNELTDVLEKLPEQDSENEKENI